MRRKKCTGSSWSTGGGCFTDAPRPPTRAPAATTTASSLPPSCTRGHHGTLWTTGEPQHPLGCLNLKSLQDGTPHSTPSQLHTFSASRLVKGNLPASLASCMIPLHNHSQRNYSDKMELLLIILTDRENNNYS